MWSIVYTKQAQKDALKIKEAGLKNKVQGLFDIIAKNPYSTPPTYEKLRGDLDGLYFRRINSQHRLIYQVYSEERTIKVIRMWTHYE